MKILVLVTFFLSFHCLADSDVRYPLHSHNDYEHQRFLVDAMENNFKSIEVDVWLSGGEVKISHLPWNFKGTLEELYLEPLQVMVDSREFKVTETNPLLLWIDIKDLRRGVIRKLARVLERYPMIGKEIRIILTGNKRLKKRFMEDYPHIPVERDSNQIDEDSKDHTWYTLKWSKFFEWDGVSEISQNELEELRLLVTSIHAQNRRLRFHASPDTEKYWELMKKLNVDLIDTDKVSLLNKFWKKITEPRP